ncbi:hypothetical protein C8A01DRAFT_35172 [Parachaetomium inaequale]|uniref:SET domain-containing protein n=1 Tax=Parachaetomium inaequale TaxID=2588326 RepID=A0AAN6PIM0_9PEZI|nr:hypothetical protein C8A01DRAFT_35172 [Parachaetomium inaequale]
MAYLGIPTETSYDGWFRAFDPTGKKGFYIDGVIRQPASILSPPASPTPALGLAPSPGSNLKQGTPPAPQAPAGSTSSPRKRAAPDSETPSTPAKRQKVEPPPGQAPRLPQKALDLLRPPRHVKPPQYNCLRCKNRPKCDHCTIDCYTAFRAKHFEPARAKLQIRQTATTGLGVFVARGNTIPKGAWLGEYLGELLPPAAREADTSDYAFTMPGLARDGVDELVIDAETHGNWTRFVNSSCRPNVLASPEQVGKVRIIALRALRKLRGGEQLLISYGRQYFEERNIKCCCAVGKEPHLPPEEVVVSESEMEMVESSESKMAVAFSKMEVDDGKMEVDNGNMAVDDNKMEVESDIKDVVEVLGG